MRGRRTRSGRRSETCSARRPLARFRVTRRARWVAWVGLGVIALRCGGDSAQRAICATARFMQLRRPATLLPSSRRAPRGCPETMLGCSGREMKPSLPASSWPGQASVLSLYSVTPLTARAKTYQFVLCLELKRAAPKISASGPAPPPPIRCSQVRRWSRRPSKFGSSCHLSEGAYSQEKRCLRLVFSLASSLVSVCIVGITRLMPGVDQPDPPGLIHTTALASSPPGEGRPFCVVG